MLKGGVRCDEWEKNAPPKEAGGVKVYPFRNERRKSEVSLFRRNANARMSKSEDVPTYPRLI